MDSRCRTAGALVSPKTCQHPVLERHPSRFDLEPRGRREGRFEALRSCRSCFEPASRFSRSSPERSGTARHRGGAMLSEIVTTGNGQAPLRTTKPESSDSLYPETSMRVRKRNGSSEPVDLNKIVRAVSRSCAGLHDVDALRVATKTISGLYDGATTRELDRLSIQTAAALISEEPEYSRLAARLLATYIDKEVRNQEIHAFSQSIATGHRLGLVNARLAEVVGRGARKLNDAIVPARDRELEYFGLRTVYDRYLLRHPETRLVIETPQQFFMRIACALTESTADALELYRLFSTLEYLPSSPTLFNAGTSHEQLSSCFLLDSPADHLESIYQKYMDV